MSDPVSLLAGPIITKIVDLAVAFGKNKYDQIYGVEGEIEKLTSNLSSIASVLRDAERCCSDSKSEQLADWLTKLRDAALDVEDILETYATEVAMREKQKNLVSVSWLSSRSDAANKIKKIVARIDMISQEKAKFHFKPEDYGGTEWKPQSTRIGLREMSFLRDTTDIVGREEEQEEVVSWLLSEEESDSNGLDSSFDRILKEMVEILTEMRHDMIPRSSIQSRILEVLDGKHFLLVLDDVWVEKLDWEPLQEFLNLCPKGSKILVTSRNGNVGKIMGAICTHTLGHLSEERCWDLFKKRVFLGESYSKDLEKIGREIIRRCNFLPLAVKAMANVQTPVIEMLKAKKLRTLLLPNNYPRDFGQALDKMFRAFRYMRVLDLSSSNIVDLPKSIGELKLLRYLDLSKNEIRFLPNTICNLYNLQVLKLLGCLWLLELPKELGNLRNLRFLELDEMFWYKCSTFPPKIGGLINLHNFHSFHVRHERGYGIEELKMMNSLEGTLHISKLENSTDAKAAEMKQKEGITKLILEWSKEDVDPQDQTAQERVLEDLEPYQNLRELHIHQYKGIRFSSWMSNAMLQNLYKISLNHCVGCRTLSLGPLPHLQELIIKGMSHLVEWPNTLYHSLTRLTISKCPQLQELPHIFPNLRVMKIKQCDALKALSVMPHVMFLTLSNNALLEDWREAHMHIVQRKHGIQDVHSERYSYMALLELKIINCPRLKELPRMFSPQKLQISRSALVRTLPTPQHSQRLQCLELDKCNGSSLIESIPSTNSLYSLIISNITNLTSLPKLPHLPKLQALYIHNCQDLVSLLHPDDTLQHLTSLKLLSISGCEKLAAFPEEGLPTSIEYLSIQNCSRLQSFPTTNYLASLTSLKDLHLEDCAKLESLPADGLPPLLQHLSIQGCCPLSQECNKDEGGKYWQMISHVADLELDSIKDPEPESFIGPKKGYFACLKSK
ncbi:hypothetical protein BVRB_1g006970 [Beta vulgaris subsp. vulgaris]|nr:hypothetical protein BVRB_1g006970 [Beta vulgaris subsp. vulgaris]